MLKYFIFIKSRFLKIIIWVCVFNVMYIICVIFFIFGVFIIEGFILFGSNFELKVYLNYDVDFYLKKIG